MVRFSFVTTLFYGAALSSAVYADSEELCSLAPETYASAKTTYPAVASALSKLENYSIATWYTDRDSTYATTAANLVATCPESSRLSIVVYGLPNKDCDAGYSSSGSVTTAEQYEAFLTELTTTIGERKVLYVLEPDAVGLLADIDSCGESAGYRTNLKTATSVLSANPNADIYLDVGYWTLMDPTKAAAVVDVVTELSEAGRVKGITLNTANYRSTDEMAELCTTFQEAMGLEEMHCIVDTSRNYNEPQSTEWCNVKQAGIGFPPSGSTGYANLDYFLWIKPPGESDGTCTDGSHTSDSLDGPAAGSFFEEAFTLLWNQGYFVQQLGMAQIGDNTEQTSIPTTSTPTPVQTPSPTTSIPSPTTGEPQTLAPVTPAPEPTTFTPAPTQTAVTLAPTPTTSEPCLPTVPSSTTPSDIPTPAATAVELITESPAQVVISTTPEATATSAPLSVVNSGSSDELAAGPSIYDGDSSGSDSEDEGGSNSSDSAIKATAEQLALAGSDMNAQLAAAIMLLSPFDDIVTPTPTPKRTTPSPVVVAAKAEATLISTSSLRSAEEESTSSAESGYDETQTEATTTATSSGGDTGVSAGVIGAACMVAGVAAVVAVMSVRARKKQLKESKSPVVSCTPQINFVSVL